MENLDICPPWCDNNEVKKYRYGLVAQLGAHHIRIVGVVGSNPIRSTKQEKSEPVSDWRRVRIFRFLRVRQ